MSLTRRGFAKGGGGRGHCGGIRGRERAWAQSADTIKVGVLHSLSGTMAISETTLKDVMLMLIEEQNKKGGLLGKKLEAVVVDPASDWPLFAEKARELIAVNKVAAVFGCWTSVSRKSVLPVFKELTAFSSIPCSMRARKRAQRLLHRRGTKPAGHSGRRLSDGQRKGRALGSRRHRLCLSAHHQQDPRGLSQGQGRRRRRHHDQLYAFGHSDWQTIVSDIKKFGSTGKKTAVVSTINGDANVPFYKELANQGIAAEDIRSSPSRWARKNSRASTPDRSSATLAAWNYFQSVDTPENAEFIKTWAPSPRTTSASPTTR